MNKKADLSMNMIILAAISLLVLAIIAYLVFGASDSIGEGTGCTGVGGDCQSGDSCNSEFPIHNAALDKSCKKANLGTRCCISAKLGSNT